MVCEVFLYLQWLKTCTHLACGGSSGGGEHRVGPAARLTESVLPQPGFLHLGYGEGNGSSVIPVLEAAAPSLAPDSILSVPL